MAIERPDIVVPGITDARLAADIAPSKRRRAEIAGQAAKFIYELTELEPLSPEFGYRLEPIRAIGAQEIAQLSARNARLAQTFAQPASSAIDDALTALRALASDLDPMREGGLLNPARRFGLIRAKPDPEAYFQRYLAAQDQIEARLSALARERDALLYANVTLGRERAATQALLASLEEAGVFARTLGEGLEARAADLEASDPVRARALRADAASEAHSRAQDIMTQMALGAQGWLALDLIENTNSQAIENAGTAIDTMVVVLTSATMVARTLTAHGLVLDRIGALRQAAGAIISDAPDKSSDGSGAACTAEALGSAFTHLYEALDTADMGMERQRSELAKAIDRLARHQS